MSKAFIQILIVSILSNLSFPGFAADQLRLPAKLELSALDGSEKLTRDKLKGKKVLIQFWASWCVGCGKVMEDLIPITTNSNTKYLSVSLDETKDQARSYFKHQKDIVKNLMTRSWIDPETSLANALKVKSLPALVLIDTEGNVIENLYGHPNAEQMKKIEAFFK